MFLRTFPFLILEHSIRVVPLTHVLDLDDADGRKLVVCMQPWPDSAFLVLFKHLASCLSRLAFLAILGLRRGIRISSLNFLRARWRRTSCAPLRRPLGSLLTASCSASTMMPTLIVSLMTYLYMLSPCSFLPLLISSLPVALLIRVDLPVCHSTNTRSRATACSACSATACDAPCCASSCSVDACWAWEHPGAGRRSGGDWLCVLGDDMSQIDRISNTFLMLLYGASEGCNVGACRCTLEMCWKSPVCPAWCLRSLSCSKPTSSS